MYTTKGQYKEKRKNMEQNARTITEQVEKKLQCMSWLKLRLKPSSVRADDIRFMYTVLKELERVGIVTEVLNDCDGFSYIKASR